MCEENHSFSKFFYRLTDIYRTLHSTTVEITFSLQVNPNFYQDTPYAGHKTSVNKFQRTEITLSIFSDHKMFQEEITWKIPNYLEIKQHTVKQHTGQRNHRGN